MSIATTLMSRGGRSHPWCKVRRWWRDDRVRRAIDENLRGEDFRRHLTASREATPRPTKRNLKYSSVAFVPMAVLEFALAEMISARSRVLRLNDLIADKQYWRHGPGLKNARDIRRRTVPVGWYADIPNIIKTVSPTRQDNGRWAFLDDADPACKRVLVVDVDESGNPTIITYHPIR